MVAPSALTAHKPPVRNRELVTGQIIARNARSSFAEARSLRPVDSLPASSRLSGASCSIAIFHCFSASVIVSTVAFPTRSAVTEQSAGPPTRTAAQDSDTPSRCVGACEYGRRNLDRADSEDVLLLFEPGHYPMAHFPEADDSPDTYNAASIPPGTPRRRVVGGLVSCMRL
jgi:hypothetical protein